MKVRFGPGGWVQWPDNEEFSIEFMRLLGAAQEGGSMISECFLAASRIDPKDGGDSWYREWMRMADLSNERANAAFTSGHVLTAQSNWLRAINYYQASAFGFDVPDTDQERALRNMRDCARSYIAHIDPRRRGGRDSLVGRPCVGGLFFAGPRRSHRTPVVVCMGDPGHRKEEYLFKVARYARERGMSLLAVDLLGSGAGAKFDEVVGRPDLELSVGCVMDYLTTRDDIDERRIAVLGDGAGRPLWRVASLSTIVSPPWFATAEFWDMHERAFLINRLSRDGIGSGGFERSWLGREIFTARS